MHHDPPRRRLAVPPALAAAHREHSGAAGAAWIAALPDLASDLLDRWRLRVDGPAAHGVVALVLPVLRADGTPAALKLQPRDEETGGEPAALRAWGGDGAVRLLDHDPPSGSLLLERLDADRPLSAVPDAPEALRVLAELLARLTARPAPEGLRRLSDVAAGLTERVPRALAVLPHPADRHLLGHWAGAVAELAGEAGDRLLHWDLHEGNVLACHPSDPREPWLAIDPKPLAGDPAFELLPALRDRWEETVATGDVRRAVRWRFDLLTEVLGLDRSRAVGWTLGRILQDALWDVESGARALRPRNLALAEALSTR